METLKKVKLVDFHPHHVELMDLKDNVKLGFMTLADCKERLEAMHMNGIDSQTMMYNGRVIFCAGYMQMWSGVMECWMLPSIHVNKVTLSFSRIIKDYIDAILSHEKCHRVQVTAPDDAFHARWMKFLGMKKEGSLRHYGPNKEDHCIYAKVKDE